MSKKKGTKKNADFDDEIEEKPKAAEVTSKGKGAKADKKKGRGKGDSEDEAPPVKRTVDSDDEDGSKGASKKNQKKGW